MQFYIVTERTIGRIQNAASLLRQCERMYNAASLEEGIGTLCPGWIADHDGVSFIDRLNMFGNAIFGNAIVNNLNGLDLASIRVFAIKSSMMENSYFLFFASEEIESQIVDQIKEVCEKVKILMLQKLTEDIDKL